MNASRFKLLVPVGMAIGIGLVIAASRLLVLGIYGVIVVTLVLALLAAMIGRWHEGPLNPVRVYALLTAGLLLSITGVLILSLLGPWGLLMLLGILVAGNLRLAGIERLRESRANAGLCVRCGYDLRATVDRCPECGDPLPEELLRRRRIATAVSLPREHPEAIPQPPGEKETNQATG